MTKLALPNFSSTRSYYCRSSVESACPYAPSFLPNNNILIISTEEQSRRLDLLAHPPGFTSPDTSTTILLSFPGQHLLRDSFNWWHRGNSLVVLRRKVLDGESNPDGVVHEVVLMSLLLHSPSSYHCSTPLPSLDIHSSFGSDCFHGTSICSHGVVMSSSQILTPEL